ncbi:MAG: monovalent cation/H+ antiporter subunit D family protein [Candidatus Altiarchaeum hamiconexum]|uniref:Monovalent cation/H+ antiporter subunit D family protein n=1 Tax=Candidatus Altarchaeum hamiconexum TaxID=1803513 RepID=A0A8J8CHA3_9ARCH|nr:monovalent cation/H+ antiporter subunit D family protein [Candidatus Altarchaeum hamiconexum]OIQ05549.1 MAG: hypothetical protein AUK59_03480 [Candidatus Altarchaeum sp. CG2_30_32_3053]PIV27229.1 MAG: cation:proton antiporter [Candidatus Altarchaeum sp. CG03_land_8_20_14_0_80_32_618]PIX48467.1 MAG: cation:proton antiporter [Candidatus Altarchaeum sp. CG_4_8_14_3_um_filter_33_2054]PIZ31793.1 MAG: cation:proton antiporter [Candidatus Altarchaeum sp. CG_4_10_14_0_8_um_filter_32_851]PJC12994.1 
MNGEILIYALLPSLIVAFILPLFKNKPNLRDGITVIATIITFLIIAFLVLPQILSGETITFKLFEFAQGITFTLKLDAFGMFFAFVTSTLWVVTNIYAIGYMRGLNEHAQTRFFVYFTLSIFAALGIAFSGNLITLFIFYEILSIVTYPLVIHEQDPKSMRSGTEYMIYLMVASMLLQLTAILLIYGMTGTLEFSEGGIGALAQCGSLLLSAIFLMLMFGYAKAAIFPLHSWLPTAMVAPTPVSALLHAVAVVVAGVFCVMRTVFDVFGPNLMHALNLDLVLGTFAAFTLLAAIFFGITQDNLKRRVAYSTVSQLSFMMLGVALLTKTGMTGGILHIASHSFGKIVLFFVAGAVFVAAHKKLISDMDGIGRRMPITMLSFAVGTAAMIAVPLTLAALSKTMLLEGSLESGYWIFFVVFLLAGLLDAFYFFPVIYKAFFKKPKKENEADYSKFKEVNILVLAPIVTVAILVVVFYAVPFPFLELAEEKISHVNPIEGVVSHEFSKHWSSIAEYGVIAIIALFLLLNYRYFGSSKGKEIIKFDTPFIYGGNPLSKTCTDANHKLLLFYQWSVKLSHAPYAWVISKFKGRNVEDIERELDKSAYKFITSSTTMALVFLIIGFIVFIIKL